MIYVCIVDDVVCTLFGGEDWIERKPERFLEEARFFDCFHMLYVLRHCKGTKLYIQSIMFCVKLYIHFERFVLKIVYTKKRPCR